MLSSDHKLSFKPKLEWLLNHLQTYLRNNESYDKIHQQLIYTDDDTIRCLLYKCIEKKCLKLAKIIFPRSDDPFPKVFLKNMTMQQFMHQAVRAKNHPKFQHHLIHHAKNDECIQWILTHDHNHPDQKTLISYTNRIVSFLHHKDISTRNRCIQLFMDDPFFITNFAFHSPCTFTLIPLKMNNFPLYIILCECFKTKNYYWFRHIWKFYQSFPCDYHKSEIHAFLTEFLRKKICKDFIQNITLEK